MNFAKMRVEAQNGWPNASEFQAEVKFAERLSLHGKAALFKPIRLAVIDDNDYQRCIGHLIDGMDALPYRPDYFFDHCFKVIDFCGTSIIPGGGIKKVTEKLGVKLVASAESEWTAIANQIAEHIPNPSLEYLAKRLLEPQDDFLAQLRKRAGDCFSPNRFAQIILKYSGHSSEKSSGTPSTDTVKKFALFLKAYLHGKVQNSRNKPSHALLDLGASANIPSTATRLQVILSLLLFHVRNERAHGENMSPFRTSKSKLERYRYYYFQMLVTYLFALGCLSLKWPKAVSANQLSVGFNENILLQEKFFAKP